MSGHKSSLPMDAPRRRSSVTGLRTSIGSSLPRPPSRGPTTSRIGIARGTSTTQPSYDFLTGQELHQRPPSRDTFRKSIRASSVGQHGGSPAIEDDEVERRRKELDALKGEVKSLQYTIENHKQEGELAKLRHDSELREVRRKGEEDFKKMQDAEGERAKAVRQYELLLKEMTDVKDAASNERAALERRLREMEESKRMAEEEVEDNRTEQEEALRAMERKSSELESRNDTLQRAVDELQRDSDRREELLQHVQRQLVDKENEFGELEAEVIRLKALTGDADTLAIIRRELGEQVAHIKKIETTNRKQHAELDHYKQLHKSIEVVEEEKRSLQRKVDSMEDLQNALVEAQIQRQRLEDERLAWTAYLQSQAGPDGILEFDSPEKLARAFIEERVRTTTLTERIGTLESEQLEKDGVIESLKSQTSLLSEEVEKVKSTGGNGGAVPPAPGETKARLRLERQRALAIKEVEYLRAQLKTFDTEDTIFNPETVDKAKHNRTQELEDMVDAYRLEVQTLHAELATRETHTAPSLPSGKRPHESSEDNEHIGVLARKNRKLQDELTGLQTRAGVLEKELQVAQECLAAVTRQSSTRILALRSNPTADHEATKQATLDALRKENADLLAVIQSKRNGVTTIPITSLEAAQRDVRDAQLALASEKKRNDRLIKVWRSKSAEFRELVISLLGWDVVFLKNGKTKVTSFFYPSHGEEENSIEFDGERGTMKVSGGPQSKFAGRIGEQIKFWVHERGSVPCFLAALTLEFYEESNRDNTTLRVD